MSLPNERTELILSTLKATLAFLNKKGIKREIGLKPTDNINVHLKYLLDSGLIETFDIQLLNGKQTYYRPTFLSKH